MTPPNAIDFPNLRASRSCPLCAGPKLDRFLLCHACTMALDPSDEAGATARRKQLDEAEAFLARPITAEESSRV